MNVRAALARATTDFARVSDTPRLDAELLMAHALGITREQLLLGQVGHVGDDLESRFERLGIRRMAHEPVAYILGRRAFWSIELEVGPGVLVPRPDSETLIEAAVEGFGRQGPATVLDLGTGPGTLLLAALTEWPQAHGIGIDRSETALGYARRNADSLGLADRVEFRSGDWSGTGDAFDLVLCNPPYVADDATLAPEVAAHEPAEALFAGADGLGDYRRLAPLIGRQIKGGGIACIEIGADQGRTASDLFAAAGLDVTIRKDLAGRHRCLVVRHRAVRAA